MTIFLSWSGERSRIAATAMHEWLLKIFSGGVDPWLSRDIEAGRRWNDAIVEKLEQAAIGILFVDGSNLTSPWLLFEAGALATRFPHVQDHALSANRYVCPYLLDLTPGDLRSSPLQQFQAKIADRAGTLDLLRTINGLRSSASINGDSLERLFHENWPHLQSRITNQPIKELWLVGASLVHSSDHGYSQLRKRLLEEGYSLNVLLPDVRDDTVVLAASRRSSKGKSPDDKQREICATLSRLCLLRQEAADYKPPPGSPPPGKLEIKTTRHVLGYGVDGTDPNGSLDIKLYPTAAYKGDKKPHFVLRLGEPQHALLKQELHDLWEHHGTVWDCNTNCRELTKELAKHRASSPRNKEEL